METGNDRDVLPYVLYRDATFCATPRSMTEAVIFILSGTVTASSSFANSVNRTGKDVVNQFDLSTLRVSREEQS